MLVMNKQAKISNTHNCSQAGYVQILVMNKQAKISNTHNCSQAGYVQMLEMNKQEKISNTHNCSQAGYVQMLVMNKQAKISNTSKEDTAKIVCQVKRELDTMELRSNETTPNCSLNSFYSGCLYWNFSIVL